MFSSLCWYLTPKYTHLSTGQTQVLHGSSCFLHSADIWHPSTLNSSLATGSGHSQFFPGHLTQVLQFWWMHLPWPLTQVLHSSVHDVHCWILYSCDAWHSSFLIMGMMINRDDKVPPGVYHMTSIVPLFFLECRTSIHLDQSTTGNCWQGRAEFWLQCFPCCIEDTGVS